MIKDPLLTIAIPTYNRSEILKLSLLKYQTMSSIFLSNNIEILIIDNFSDDSTVEIVKEFKINNPAIKLIMNSSNIGGVRNIIKCFKQNKI